MTLGERIEAACANDWLTMSQLCERLGCSRGGCINAIKHLNDAGRLKSRKNPTWSGRQYRVVEPVARVRAVLVKLAEDWGEEHGVDLKGLLWRMRAKDLD